MLPKLKNHLSKSTFLRGLQCEKSLYLYKHHYNLKDPITPSHQSVLEEGNKIGILAQKLFPNGVNASTNNELDIFDSIEKTKKLILDGAPIIYEASFQYDDVFAAIDILVKVKDGWKAYEVKSSTKISDVYIKDAAIQFYTISNSGIKLKDVSIIFINNGYVRKGDLDINKLFSIQSVYDNVFEFLPRIPNDITRLKNIIASPEVPQITIGQHCSDPYECDFRGTCWKHIPEYSVFDITRLNNNKKFELYNQGIVSLDQIDLNNTNLNSNQILQVEAEVKGTSHINKTKISDFISGLNYPLYFLDFETIGPAVPIYENSSPFQQLVFQYSLHIKHSPTSDIIHREYLADPKVDPRIGFVEQLIKDCGLSGDVIVYNLGFEKGKLKDLIDIFPQYANELIGIIDRLKDLMIPFQQRWYYTPEMKGSYSIKYILPALVPEFSYDSLEIKEGGTASNTFLSMVNDTFNGDIDEKRKHLLEYCTMDTYAMIKILDKLFDIVG